MKIQLVPNAKKSDFFELNPVVYFLCWGNDIVYIGQSVNVYSRIGLHMSEGKKKFDSVFTIDCHESWLDDIERCLITFFKPKYNRTHVYGRVLSEKDMNILRSIGVDPVKSKKRSNGGKTIYNVQCERERVISANIRRFF